MTESLFDQLSLSVRRAQDSSRRFWLRVQLWNTEVELESIDQERQRLDAVTRDVLVQRAELLVQLRSASRSVTTRTVSLIEHGAGRVVDMKVFRFEGRDGKRLARHP